FAVAPRVSFISFRKAPIHFVSNRLKSLFILTSCRAFRRPCRPYLAFRLRQRFLLGGLLLLLLLLGIVLQQMLRFVVLSVLLLLGLRYQRQSCLPIRLSLHRSQRRCLLFSGVLQ